jgi:RNA polymerase sigma factor (sigma-70 family)
LAALTLQSLIRRLGRDARSTDEQSDADLLARFVARRDEAAFELLVWRHGAMVLNLCRRMLRHEPDAEDAFQATFLALAREAHRISDRDALGGWLYRVAFRIAVKSRATTRRMVPGSVPDRSGPDSTRSLETAELHAILDEEVQRLPAKYRLPFVLCCLAGRSNSEAAREIGCPRGTVDSRLSWAKQRLRLRLIKRGFAPTATVIALESLVASDAAATVPAAFIRETVRLSINFLGGTAGILPAPAALARGVIQTMFLDRIKQTAFAVVAIAAFAGSAGLLTVYVQADDKPVPAKPQPPVPGQKPDKPAPTPPTKPAPAPKPAAPLETSETNQKLWKSFDQVIDIVQPIDASLKDVLEFFSDRFDLKILVDITAFALCDPPVPEVENTRVKLPKLPSVELRTTLELVLEPIGAKAIIKRGLVYIVPVGTVTATKDDGPLPSSFLDRVRLVAKERPFADAIRELADQSGANIVIDPRTKDQAKVLINAQLQDAPLLSAVRVLADMVELKVVTMDNVIYVTTAENAGKWKKEHTRMTTVEAPKPVVPSRPMPK